MDQFKSPRWQSRALVGLLTCSSVISPVFPQTKQAISVPDLQSLTTGARLPSRSLETKPPTPVDAPVNPSEYIVGPGDQLAINVWSSSPLEYQLTISPEASLIIPNTGIIDVKDLSLASVKGKVSEIMGRKFVNSTVSVTLQSPRKLVVDISGYVLNEGKKEVSAVERVDQLIAECNALPQDRMTFEEYSREILRLRKAASERRILVRSRDGKTHIVDIPLYRATGAGSLNPYLREGDAVYVPQRQEKDLAIGIFGSAMESANFEFVQGDSLSSLIAMCLGFRQDSDPEHAILTRLKENGTTMDTERVDLTAVIAHRAPNIALKPGDRVIIPAFPPILRDYRVSIEGEVRSPGSYPISRNGTHLSTIIALAGGTTEDANVSAAVLHRSRFSTNDSPDDMRQELMLAERANLDIEDTSSYRVESSLRLSDEVASLDFRRLLIDGDTTQDIILHNGDRIVFPTSTRTVYVFGQVRRPGHVPFRMGASVDFFIALAGGFGDEARTGDVKVIKSSTRAWLEPSDTQVEDGDFIWVPREPIRPFGYYVTIYAQIASIIAAIATVALLVRTL